MNNTDVFYGQSTPTEEPAVDGAGESAAPSTAEVLFGAQAVPEERDDVPEAVKALREGDAAAAFYDPVPVKGLEGIDPLEAGRVAGDLGASRTDVEQFETLAAQALAADGDQHAAWLAESMRLVASGEVSQDDLALARKLTARDPRLASYLDHTGLTNHPVVVKRVVELARSERSRGRLR